MSTQTASQSRPFHRLRSTAPWPLALALLCAAPTAVVHGQATPVPAESVPEVAPAPSPRVVIAAPSAAPPTVAAAPAPAGRVIIAAPPPASAAPSPDGPAPFTPTDSPLLLAVKHGPQGKPPPREPDLWPTRPRRAARAAVAWGFGAGYVLGAATYPYSYGYRYGYPCSYGYAYPYGYLDGFGLGITTGHPYRYGHGHGRGAYGRR